MSLAGCGLLDSSGMAKAAHPSALCLRNAVTCQCACVCLKYIHTYVQTKQTQAAYCSLSRKYTNTES